MGIDYILIYCILNVSQVTYINSDNCKGLSWEISLKYFTVTVSFKKFSSDIVSISWLVMFFWAQLRSSHQSTYYLCLGCKIYCDQILKIIKHVLCPPGTNDIE